LYSIIKAPLLVVRNTFGARLGGVECPAYIIVSENHE
jgi:hypothetical protein